MESCEVRPQSNVFSANWRSGFFPAAISRRQNHGNGVSPPPREVPSRPESSITSLAYQASQPPSTLRTVPVT